MEKKKIMGLSAEDLVHLHSLGKAPPQELPEEWEPALTPSQKDLYYDDRKYILAHGERGSGKTIAALHKDIRHCYLFDEAMVLLVTITRSAGQLGGAWYDLTSMSRFAEGPMAGMPAGVLQMWREGFGLEWGNFTTGKKNTYWTTYQDASKNMWVDIRNQHGGISRIVFKSMPAASLVIDRIKDVKPSYFHFEELTNTHDPVFFDKVIQQLGRLRSVPEHAQQYVATCNPAANGQAHWVFKTWMVNPHVLKPGTQEKLADHEFDFPGDIETLHPDYGIHHVRMIENDFMAGKDQYIKRIIETARNDPTEYNRAVLGQWVPKVSGETIFGDYFEREIHVRGTAKSGLEPVINEPIIIGYDPGMTNNARVFMQRNFIAGQQPVWRSFDEVVNKARKIHFEVLVRDLLERMWWWCDRYKHKFAFFHVADRQALTHFNPHGSYEYKEYEKISKRLIDASPRYSEYLTPIRMRAPQKGPDSIAERVRLMQQMLLTETFYLSTQCPHQIQMFDNLRKAKDRNQNFQDERPLKSIDGHIHTFDAISYPIYYFSQRGTPDAKSRNSELAMIRIGVR